MPDLETKTLLLEIKDADKGEVEAVVATLDVVDRDGDVIRAGAIRSGSKVKMSSYGHDAVWGNAPVGKGAITVTKDRAVFEGRIFLATARGRETFDVLKEMGADQDWSFGFFVLGSELPDEAWRDKGARRILTKLQAFEVSPVMVGAGRDTGTLSVKDADADAQATAAREAAAAQQAQEIKTTAAAEVAAGEFDRFQRQAQEHKTAAAARVAAGEFARFHQTLKRFGIGR